MPVSDGWRRVLSRVGLTRRPGEIPPRAAVEVSRSGALPLFRLSGELDHHAANGVRRAVEEIVERKDEGDPPAEDQETPLRPELGLLFDLEELNYIDSGGLALFFDIARAFEEEGDVGYLGILNPGPNIRRLLDISGLGGISSVRILTEPGSPEPSSGAAG